MLSVGLGFINDGLEVTASTSLPKSTICQSQDFESYMDNDLVLSLNGMPKKDLFKLVCKMLHISNLEFLSICSPDEDLPIVGLNWVELFKRCPEVTTMQASGWGIGFFVRALLRNTRCGWKKKSTQAQPAKSTAPHAHAPIFPKLSFLSLSRLDFGEMNPPGILFDVVRNGLQQRKVAYGAPLKMLRINKCIISTKRAKALQKLVEKLLWDGDEWGI